MASVTGGKIVREQDVLVSLVCLIQKIMRVFMEFSIVAPVYVEMTCVSKKGPALGVGFYCGDVVSLTVDHRNVL
jgi:hypothetical protein